MSSRPTVSTGNCKCHIVTEEACTVAPVPCAQMYLDPMDTTWYRLFGPRGTCSLFLSSGTLYCRPSFLPSPPPCPGLLSIPRSPCIRSKPQRNKRAAHHIIYSSKKKITLHKVASCGREIKTVPGMICAQEEDILNKGEEARVRSEHRF